MADGGDTPAGESGDQLSAVQRRTRCADAELRSPVRPAADSVRKLRRAVLSPGLGLLYLICGAPPAPGEPRGTGSAGAFRLEKAARQIARKDRKINRAVVKITKIRTFRFNCGLESNRLDRLESTYFRPIAVIADSRKVSRECVRIIIKTGMSAEQTIYPAQKIYTTGCTGREIGDLKPLLTRLTAVLIDVRLTPTAPHLEWRKNYLQLLLKERYRHIPQLGSRAFREGAPMIQNLALGIRIICSMNSNLILMGECAELNRCHRAVIAEELERRGVDTTELADWKDF